MMRKPGGKVLRSVFYFIVVILIWSCGEKSFREKIAGRWRVKSFVIQNPDELHPELVSETTSIAESVRYRFNNDFTYDIRSKVDTKSSSGTWKYNSVDNQLIMNMRDQDKTVSDITWVSDEELVLQTEMGQIGEVNLTLVKIDE